VAVQPKRLALLAYLAVTAPGALVRRDTLLALFWPDLGDDEARRALRQALHHLRRVLEPDSIAVRGADLVGIRADAVSCDAAALRDALRSGRARDALALWRGEFLDGFYVTDVAAELEEWVALERTRLREDAVAAAWEAAETAERAGAPVDAADFARRAVELAPDDERGVRRYIALLERLGDRGAALRAHAQLVARLRREFDAAPSLETETLAARLRAPGPAAALPPTVLEPVAAGTASPIAGAAAPLGSTPPLAVSTVAAPAVADASPRMSIGRRRLPRWAAAAALVATVVLVVGRPRPPLVAVGAIENETGAAAEEVSQLPSLVTTELARTERLRVLGRQRLAELARRLATGADSIAFAATAAQEAGAGELVEGTLYRRMSGYRLDLRRVELPSGVVRAVASAEGDDAFDVVRRASAALAAGSPSAARADLASLPAFLDWPRWRIEP
jgi:DNA-binding SARP family transcriptional activator